MKTNNAKILAKIQELKNEFLKLQADEGFEFASDTDGFIEWLVWRLFDTEYDLKSLRADVAEHNCEHGIF